MDLQEVGWGGINWFDLALVNSIMNPRVPYSEGNVLTSREPVSFSGRTLSHGDGCLIGWLVGRLVGWLVGRSFGWLVVSP